MLRHCNKIHHLIPCWCGYVIKKRNLRVLYRLIRSISPHSQSFSSQLHFLFRVSLLNVSNVVPGQLSWKKKEKEKYVKFLLELKKNTQMCSEKNYKLPLNFLVYIGAITIFRFKKVVESLTKQLACSIWQKIKPSTKMKYSSLLECFCMSGLEFKVKYALEEFKLQLQC